MISGRKQARARAFRLFGFALVPLLLLAGTGVEARGKPTPPPTTEAPHRAGPQPWAPMLAAAPPAGVTATASADCAGGTGSISGYPAGENHTAFLTLTYGDDSVQKTVPFQQSWNSNNTLARPANWPSDAIWWVAVSVDSAQAEAFAAARVPLECRMPRPPQISSIQPGPNRVLLRWFQLGTLAVSDYVIQHSLNGTTWTTIADGVSTATSYTATGLTNNVNHFFRIAAVGANGQG